MELHEKRCVPCEGDVPPLKKEQIDLYLRDLNDWQVIGNKLIKIFDFIGPGAALEFVCKTGQAANEENHHPITEWTFRRVKVTIYTHAINGLSENDFILAAKFDKIFEAA